MLTPEEKKGKQFDNDIFNGIIEKLKEKENWIKIDSDAIEHKTDNIIICFDIDAWIGGKMYMQNPSFVRAPFKYVGKMKKLIRDIISFRFNQEKIFVLDYLNGVYPHFLKFDKIPRDYKENFNTWLKKDVEIKNYFIIKEGHKYGHKIERVIYFKREKDYAFIVLKWL